MARKTSTRRTQGRSTASGRKKASGGRATTRSRSTSAASGRARNTRTQAGVPSPWRRPAVQALSVLGVLGSVYATLCLASYDPTDPSFTRSGGGEVSNLGGPLGAWVADALLQIFGVGAWGVLLIGAAIAWRLAGRSLGGTARMIAWAAVFWSGLCALALIAPADPTAAYPLGGMVGMISVSWLASLFGTAGAWIIVVGTVLACAPFVARVDWEDVAARGVGGVEAMVPHAPRRCGTPRCRTLRAAVQLVVRCGTRASR